MERYKPRGTRVWQAEEKAALSRAKAEAEARRGEAERALAAAEEVAARGHSQSEAAERAEADLKLREQALEQKTVAFQESKSAAERFPLFLTF